MLSSLESSVLIISISKLNQNLDRLDVLPILHNTYMEILSETGLIGVLLFMLLIFFLIKKTYLISRSKNNAKWLLIS